MNSHVLPNYWGCYVKPQKQRNYLNACWRSSPLYLSCLILLSICKCGASVYKNSSIVWVAPYFPALTWKSCLFLVLKLKISGFDVTLLNLNNEGMGLEKYIKERTEIQVELLQVRCQKLGVDSGSSWLNYQNACNKSAVGMGGESARGVQSRRHCNKNYKIENASAHQIANQRRLHPVTSIAFIL